MKRRLISLVACTAFIMSALIGPLSPLIPLASAADNDAPNATLDNVSPRAENSTPNGGHVHFIRKQGQWAGIQPFVDLKAYYPDTVSQWNSLYLQLVPGSNLNANDATDNSGHNFICDVITTNMSNPQKDQFLIITLKSLGAQGGVQDTKKYYIKAGQVCKTPANTQNQTGNDPGNQFYARYKLPAKPAAVDDVTGKYVVDINITYGGGVPVDPDQGIRFQVKGPVDQNVPSNNDVLIGQLGNLNSTENFSVLGDWDIHDRVDATNLSVPFGQCDATNNGVAIDHKDIPVTIYDADDGLFTHDVRFRVRDMDGNDPNTNANGYVHFGAKGSDGQGPGSGKYSPDDTVFYPPNGSGKTVGGAWAKMPTFLANEHYQLEIYGLNARNTVDIGLPGDAVYGVTRCRNMNKPQMICSVSVAPSDISTGDAVHITVRGQASGYGGAPPTKVKLGTTSPTAASQVVGPIPTDPNLNSYKNTFDSVAGAPGIYTVNAYATDVNPGTGGTDQCPAVTYVVTSKPYVSIYGGDAEAGVSPQYDGTAFSTYTNASEPGGFVGWNDNDGSGSWGSAGAQWAVQAIGGIYGFASARGVTLGTPQYLSFTNTSNVSGNSYGGLYDGTGSVKLDYASDISKAAAGDTYNGDTVFPGGAVGTKTVVVNNGDAFISNPMTYSTYSWATPSDIPSYKFIVVGGDLYINRTVTKLDGTYIAIPKVLANGTTVGGNIYTCSAELTPTTYVPYDPSNTTWWPLLKPVQYSLCSQQLKVYGSLVAKQVHFDRTFGNYNNQTKPYNTTDAAEAIIYGPEMWLSSTPGGSSNYSAITGLPPIL